MATMNAAVLTEYGQFTWKEVPIPDINDHEVLIRVEYAGICGTDQHIFKGEFHPRTQIPFIPGHEFAGTVVEIGKKVDGYKIGNRVVVDPIFWCGKCAACQLGHYPACSSLKLKGVDVDGGFAEYVSVSDFMLFPVPDALSGRHAALVEVLSIGFHACSRASLKQGDTVAIYGCGKIGHVILQAVRTITSGTVFMIDLIDERMERAKEGYPDIITINPADRNPIEVIQEMTDGRGVDVAFEAVGHAVEIKDRPHPVRGCIQAIRGAGTVCVLGMSDEPAQVMMKEFIWKEAKLIASRVTHGEFKDTLHHMALGHLKPDILITSELPGKCVQEGFRLLDSEPERQLKILLKF